jgi:hypothetical protein
MSAKALKLTYGKAVFIRLYPNLQCMLPFEYQTAHKIAEVLNYATSARNNIADAVDDMKRVIDATERQLKQWKKDLRLLSKTRKQGKSE